MPHLANLMLCTGSPNNFNITVVIFIAAEPRKRYLNWKEKIQGIQHVMGIILLHNLNTHVFLNISNALGTKIELTTCGLSSG